MTARDYDSFLLGPDLGTFLHAEHRRHRVHEQDFHVPVRGLHQWFGTAGSGAAPLRAVLFCAFESLATPAPAAQFEELTDRDLAHQRVILRRQLELDRRLARQDRELASVRAKLHELAKALQLQLPITSVSAEDAKLLATKAGKFASEVFGEDRLIETALKESRSDSGSHWTISLALRPAAAETVETRAARFDDFYARLAADLDPEIADQIKVRVRIRR